MTISPDQFSVEHLSKGTNWRPLKGFSLEKPRKKVEKAWKEGWNPVFRMKVQICCSFLELRNTSDVRDQCLSYRGHFHSCRLTWEIVEDIWGEGWLLDFICFRTLGEVTQLRPSGSSFHWDGVLVERRLLVDEPAVPSPQDEVQEPKYLRGG